MKWRSVPDFLQKLAAILLKQQYTFLYTAYVLSRMRSMSASIGCSAGERRLWRRASLPVAYDLAWAAS
jgi:hypothetical protein